MTDHPPIPVTQSEVDNILHRLNLGRPDIAALPDGATIAVNVTTHRQVADIILRLWNTRAHPTEDREGLIGQLKEIRDAIFYCMTRNAQTPDVAMKALGQVKESLTEIIHQHEAEQPFESPCNTDGSLKRESRSEDREGLIEKLTALSNQNHGVLPAGEAIDIVRQHEATQHNQIATDQASDNKRPGEKSVMCAGPETLETACGNGTSMGYEAGCPKWGAGGSSEISDIIKRDLAVLSAFALGITPDKNTQTPEEVEQTYDYVRAVARKYDPHAVGYTEPVSISLEKCAKALLDKSSKHGSWDRQKADARNNAKIVLDAAGVKYHAD